MLVVAGTDRQAEIKKIQRLFSISATHAETALLLGEGFSTAAAIAAERGLAERTVLKHLRELVRLGYVEVSPEAPASARQLPSR